jgi:hypothetical protein
MTNPDAIPWFHSLVPPVTALEATALELLLAAGLLGRQTLFGDSLQVVFRVGFGDALLSSTAAAFLMVGFDDAAVRDAGLLQFDETIALFLARPFSASLSFGEEEPLAFGCRCGFFVVDGGRRLL